MENYLKNMSYSIDYIKEEYDGSSSLQEWNNEEEIPRQMKALLENDPPPFLSKTYDLVDDPSTITSSRGVEGFRKVDQDKWEFANEGFLRGQKHLLKNILRRKTHSSSSPTSSRRGLGSCAEVQQRYGLDTGIDRLRSDRQVLVMELLKLRQQHRTALSCLKTMEQRLKVTERKQKNNMSFLVKGIQNPNFFQRLLEHKGKKKDLEEGISNKRRRRILDHVSRNAGENTSLSAVWNTWFQELGQESEENESKNDVGIGKIWDEDVYVELEPKEYGEISKFGVFDIEKLASSSQIPQLSMMGNSSEKTDSRKSIDEEFWDDFVNGFDEIGTLGVEDRGDVWAEHLGFLGLSL